MIKDLKRVPLSEDPQVIAAHLFGAPEGMLSDRAEQAHKQWQSQMPEHADKFSPMVLIARMLEASQIIGRDFLNPVYAEFGLKSGEFEVLATLMRSGSPYRLTPTELYKMTMMSSGGMTARLDRLEKSGLVNRQPDANDRRSLVVNLTPKGLELISRMMPVCIEAQHRSVEGLSGSEQMQLSELLEKLVRTTKEQDLP